MEDTGNRSICGKCSRGPARRSRGQSLPIWIGSGRASQVIDVEVLESRVASVGHRRPELLAVRRSSCQQKSLLLRACRFQFRRGVLSKFE